MTLLISKCKRNNVYTGAGRLGKFTPRVVNLPDCPVNLPDRPVNLPDTFSDQLVLILLIVYFMFSVFISICLNKSCVKSLPNMLFHFDKLYGCQQVSSSETIGRFPINITA